MTVATVVEAVEDVAVAAEAMEEECSSNKEEECSSNKEEADMAMTATKSFPFHL